MHGQKGRPKIGITVRSAGNRRVKCSPDQFNDGRAKEDSRGRRKPGAILDARDFDDEGRTGESGSIPQS